MNMFKLITLLSMFLWMIFATHDKIELEIQSLEKSWCDPKCRKDGAVSS